MPEAVAGSYQTFGDVAGRHRPEEMHWVLPTSKVRRGSRFLDVGCAEGYFVFAAEWYGAEAYGVDLDPHVVTAANARSKERRSRAWFVRCEVMDLPKWPETKRGFDVVLCLSLLHHLHHPKEALRLLRSITRDTLVVEALSWRPGCGLAPCDELRPETRLGVGRRELPTRACWQAELERLFGSVSYMGTGKAGDRHVFRAEVARPFDVETALSGLRAYPRTQQSDVAPPMLAAEAVFGRAVQKRHWNAFDEAHVVRRVKPAGLTPSQDVLRVPTIEAMLRDQELMRATRPTIHVVDEGARQCLIADGHHRLAAAILAGESTVECNVLVRKAGKFKANVTEVVGKGSAFDPEVWCATSR